MNGIKYRNGLKLFGWPFMFRFKKASIEIGEIDGKKVYRYLLKNETIKANTWFSKQMPFAENLWTFPTAIVPHFLPRATDNWAVPSQMGPPLP